MDTLLGENKLTAYDASGNDPYNTTGKTVPAAEQAAVARASR